MVSGISQRKALNGTALKAANWISQWGWQITEEMKKQKIDRLTKRTPIGDHKSFLGFGSHTTDDKETIAFERGDIRRMLDEMAELVRELRRFEKKKPDADF